MRVPCNEAGLVVEMVLECTISVFICSLNHHKNIMPPQHGQICDILIACLLFSLTFDPFVFWFLFLSFLRFSPLSLSSSACSSPILSHPLFSYSPYLSKLVVSSLLFSPFVDSSFHFGSVAVVLLEKWHTERPFVLMKVCA